MNGPITSLVERLCLAKNPCGFQDWFKRDGYYAAACRIAPEDVPGLIEIALNGSHSASGSDGDSPNLLQDNLVMLPVTAWRTLADVKAETAVEPLIEMIRESDGEFDEWMTEELHHVFGKIGKSAIPSLHRVASDQYEEELVRIIVVRALGSVAAYHSDTRDQVVACLTHLMDCATEDAIEFNMSVFDQLIELEAEEAAKSIERAVAANVLDLSMPGDWADASRLVAAKGIRLQKPNKADDADDDTETWLVEFGNSIFSDEPIFIDGVIDEDAEAVYYEQASGAFCQSPEASQVIDRGDEMGWYRMLLEYGIHYLGQTVDTMTLESVTGFVLDYVPRKVTTSPDSAPAIVYELVRFWEFLDRVYALPEAKSIIAWLSQPGLVPQLKTELSDTSNYGIAKSLFMMANDAGYDMTSQEGCNDFMAAFNQGKFTQTTSQATPTYSPALPTATAPIRRDHHVGRNDPCPCGSGRKFKKCCR
jgi:hypothetical protein